jgi:hypothetical protein
MVKWDTYSNGRDHFTRAREFERTRDKALDQEALDAKASGKETGSCGIRSGRE